MVVPPLRRGQNKGRVGRVIGPYTEALKEVEWEARASPVLACDRCGTEMDAGSWTAMKEWCLRCWRLFFGLSWRRIP